MLFSPSTTCGMGGVNSSPSESLTCQNMRDRYVGIVFYFRNCEFPQVPCSSQSTLPDVYTRNNHKEADPGKKKGKNSSQKSSLLTSLQKSLRLLRLCWPPLTRIALLGLNCCSNLNMDSPEKIKIGTTWIYLHTHLLTISASLKVNKLDATLDCKVLSACHTLGWDLEKIQIFLQSPFIARQGSPFFLIKGETSLAKTPFLRWFYKKLGPFYKKNSTLTISPDPKAKMSENANRFIGLGK